MRDITVALALVLVTVLSLRMSSGPASSADDPERESEPEMEVVDSRRGAVFYFAYGSNMYIPRMEQRMTNAHPAAMDHFVPLRDVVRTAIPARLDGWQLVFDKIAYDGYGFANVVPRQGAVVHGVVYKCPSDLCLRYLDYYEGVDGGHYERQPVTVLLTGPGIPAHHRIAAVTYRALHVDTTVARVPPPDYLMLLLEGAARFLPDIYTMRELHAFSSTTTDMLSPKWVFLHGTSMDNQTLVHVLGQKAAARPLLNAVLLGYKEVEGFDTIVVRSTADSIVRGQLYLTQMDEELVQLDKYKEDVSHKAITERVYFADAYDDSDRTSLSPSRVQFAQARVYVRTSSADTSL